MKLVLLTEVQRVAPGLFRTERAIRKMIERGALKKGLHWFQERPRCSIRIDLDAVVEKFTAKAVEARPDGRWPITGRSSAFDTAQEGTR